MRISARTEYGCIAMLELAEQYGSEKPVRIRRIAERHGVPPRFLVQILLQLKGAGLVESVRGAAGGYRLIVPPDEVSLGRVMGIVDTGSAADEHLTAARSDSPTVKVLTDAWREVTNAQRAMLDRIKLADLIERSRAHTEQMYHI